LQALPGLEVVPGASRDSGLLGVLLRQCRRRLHKRKARMRATMAGQEDSACASLPNIIVCRPMRSSCFAELSLKRGYHRRAVARSFLRDNEGFGKSTTMKFVENFLQSGAPDSHVIADPDVSLVLPGGSGADRPQLVLDGRYRGSPRDPSEARRLVLKRDGARREQYPYSGCHSDGNGAHSNNLHVALSAVDRVMV